MEALLTTEGYAIFLTGVLAILLTAIWIFKNYLAGLMWGLSFIVLIFVGVFGVSIEIFWMSVILTVILLMAGMAVRGI